MKSKHTLVIRMGATEWSVTVLHQGATHRFDMRKLDAKTQRQVIFKVVEAVRIIRDNQEKIGSKDKAV
jgi:hypothetical protein